MATAKKILSMAVGVAFGFLGSLGTVSSFAAEPTAAKTPDDRAEAEAGTILERWVTLIRGTESAAVAPRTVERRGSLQLGRNGSPQAFVAQVQENAYRLEYELGANGPLIQAYDGSMAWQENQSLGFGSIPDAEHRANLAIHRVDPAGELSRRYPVARRLADERLNKAERQVVEMLTTTGRREKWYFDPATGHRVRVEQEEERGTRTIDFSDFRATTQTGRLEPFRVVCLENGRRLEFAYQQVEYGRVFAAERFAATEDQLGRHRLIEEVLRQNAIVSGREAVAELQSRVTEQFIEVTNSGVKVEAIMYQKRPNFFLTEQESPGLGKVLRGYDGRTGWAWNEVEGYREVKGSELAQLINSAEMEGPLRVGAQMPMRRLAGKKEVDGRTLYGIVLSSAQGVAGVFFFDAATSQLAEMESLVQAGPNGQLRVTMTFSDYREVDGVTLPFRSTLTNPAVSMVITTKSVKHNVPLEDAMFAPRRE